MAGRNKRVFASVGSKVTRAGDRLGETTLGAIDKVAEARYPAAISAVAKLRVKRPSATPSELADEIISRTRKELTTVGVVVGGVATVPGVGTVSALGASGAEFVAVFARIADMILEIGVAYGYEDADIEERRLWVLTSLVGVAAMQQVAAQFGLQFSRGMGAKIVGKVSGQQLRRINALLGRQIITKYGTRRGVIVLGRIVPMGIGAVVGGGANLLLVTTTGKHAKHFFDDTAWAEADVSPHGHDSA